MLVRVEGLEPDENDRRKLAPWFIWDSILAFATGGGDIDLPCLGIIASAEQSVMNDCILEAESCVRCMPARTIGLAVAVRHSFTASSPPALNSSGT